MVRVHLNFPPIYTQTPGALGPVAVKPTDVEVKKEVPFIDLKVFAHVRHIHNGESWERQVI